jgi:hypothetical protein
MEHSNNRSDVNSLKMRGKTAIDAEHKDISIEDERKITNRICNLYGVALEEAKDIHINYHVNRVINLLLHRAKNQGMTEPMFLARIQNLDILTFAYCISQGDLREMAAIDILYKQLCNIGDNNDDSKTADDRYMGFYG